MNRGQVSSVGELEGDSVAGAEELSGQAANVPSFRIEPNRTNSLASAVTESGSSSYQGSLQANVRYNTWG